MTKGRATFTTLTASGTTATLDASASVETTLLLKSSNGTGTITAPASFAVQLKASGGSAWYTMTTLLGSTTSGVTDDLAVAIPGPVAAVQVVYAAPAGASSPSLSGEIATLTP